MSIRQPSCTTNGASDIGHRHRSGADVAVLLLLETDMLTQIAAHETLLGRNERVFRGYMLNDIASPTSAQNDRCSILALHDSTTPGMGGRDRA